MTNGEKHDVRGVLCKIPIRHAALSLGEIAYLIVSRFHADIIRGVVVAGIVKYRDAALRYVVKLRAEVAGSYHRVGLPSVIVNAIVPLGVV